jgi:FkbM family methyltransferase
MITPSLKEFIIKTVRSFGFNITKYPLRNLDNERLHCALEHWGIELIIDIGANIGQFSQEVRKVGYKKKIVSFEPLSDAYEHLLTNSHHDKNWQIHERCAVGNKNGVIEINVAGNSQSSSILPMLTAHSDATPGSEYFKKENTNIITLDSVFTTYHSNDEKTFLKIDTQGYEKEVLEGASETLKQVKAIQIELSLVPLYQGQPLWDDLIADLTKKGFFVWSILPVLHHPQTGQFLQIDVVLYRP